jgi:hypothetical protein
LTVPLFSPNISPINSAKNKPMSSRGIWEDCDRRPHRRVQREDVGLYVQLPSWLWIRSPDWPLTKAVLVHNCKVLPSVTLSMQSIWRNHIMTRTSSKLYRVQEIPIAALSILGSCSYIYRIAAKLHKVLLFTVWLGQSSKDFPLQEEVLSFHRITGTENKECTAPTTSRTQQNFAAPSVYQTGTNEEFC